jgi:hypothetical protein
MVIDKIVEGYHLSINEFQHKLSGEPGSYVLDNIEALGGKAEVYHPLRRIGGALAWVMHPVMAYRALQLDR